MKMTHFTRLLPLVALLLVSCEMPAPVIISNPMPSPAMAPSYAQSPSALAPARYAYPSIAGVWQGPYATITIGRSSGASFPMSMHSRSSGKVHASTGHWGQPYHRHFTFQRSTGTTARATLNSLNPTTISVEEEDGRVRDWTRISSL